MLGEISSPPQNPGNLLLLKHICRSYSFRLTSSWEERRHLLHSVCFCMPLFPSAVLRTNQAALLESMRTWMRICVAAAVKIVLLSIFTLYTCILYDGASAWISPYMCSHSSKHPQDKKWNYDTQILWMCSLDVLLNTWYLMFYFF